MRRLKLCILAIFLLAFVNSAGAATLVFLNSATAPGSGNIISPPTPSQTYQATETCSGTCSATVQIEGSDDLVGWVTLGTITLSGTSPQSDGFASAAAWIYTRADLTAISGTSAAVTVTMGAQ